MVNYNLKTESFKNHPLDDKYGPNYLKKNRL